MSEDVKATKKKVLILSGVSSSGKTSVANILKRDFGFSQPTQFTTRAKRTDAELDEYVFLSESAYFKKLGNWDFANFQRYNGNFYAISKYFPDWNSVIIVDNVGKLQLTSFLKELEDVEVKSVFLEIPQSILITRLTEFRRSTVNEIRERVKDFDKFSPVWYDYVIDWDNSIERVTEEVVKALRSWKFLND